MRLLGQIPLDEGTFPGGAVVETNSHSFQGGGLRSGRVTRIRIPLPGNGWDALRVEAELAAGGEASVVCGADRFTIVAHAVAPAGGAILRHRILKNQHEPLAEVPSAVSEPGARKVAFDFGRAGFCGSLDGVPVVEAPAPLGLPAYLGQAFVEFWGDCLVRSLRVMGDGEWDAPPFVVAPKRDAGFALEVNVDFFDDLVHAPFSPAMFDALFAEFKSWGVRRCHWIYYGGTRHGWWRYTPSGVAENAAKTVALSGEIFPAAVQAAHSHGVEIYGLVKPFDMGFWRSLPPGSSEAAQMGKTERIGGPKYWIADFPAQRPDLLMARKPSACGPPLNRTVNCIELVKEDDGPCAFDPQRVELHVSPDNAVWKKYEGPVRIEETVADCPVREHAPSGFRETGRTARCRVIRLSGFEIREPFFAIRTDGRNRSFVNRLVDLVRVFGENGEETRLTFGLVPRLPMLGSASAGGQGPFALGVEFDVAPGTPTAVFPGYDAMRAPYAFDGGEGFLAVAMGKDATAVGALSPSFKESRAWWQEWLADCLDAGADGVELRMRNHHSPLAWAEFGFEPPVAEEFLRRHGVDILATDDFDREAWRRLRGEAYTQFCREARALVDGYGKRLGLHVSVSMDMPTAEGGAMDMHWDWRTWLEEGLADSITLKEVWPNTRFEREILSVARPLGVQAVFCPYANNLWAVFGGERIVRDRIRSARAAGHDGFQYYECASVVRARNDGTLEMLQPGLRQVFQEEF